MYKKSVNVVLRQLTAESHVIQFKLHKFDPPFTKIHILPPVFLLLPSPHTGNAKPPYPLRSYMNLSDHAPILLSTGMPKPQMNHQFKFELGWLLRDGFDDLVKEIWSRPVVGSSPIHIWNNKMHNMRTFLRGWARHTTGILKKEKARLSAIIENLDGIAVERALSPQEIELKCQSNVQIARLLREEEVKWYQRSKAQFILEGDSNTRYFHSVANGRHRKKLIHSLNQDEGVIKGQDEL